ncbi:MAG: hypothetical protein ACYC2H_04465 [Thermoplasmatota archaeon]
MIDLSHLDTSVGALIRSGAAILGIVLGGFILGAKPRSRRTVCLGLFFVLDGLGYATYSLAGGFNRFPHKELIVPSHVFTTAVSLATAGLLVATFWPDVVRLRRSRLEFAAAVVAALASILLNPFMFFVADAHPPLEDYGSVLALRMGEIDSAAFGIYLAATFVVSMALLARLRSGFPGSSPRAHLLLASHFIVNSGIMVGFYMAIATTATGDGLTELARVGFIVCALALLPVPLALLRLGAVGGWSKWVPVGILWTALAVMAIDMVLLLEDLRDYGFGGIVSLLGLGAVGYAIFRLDLLGVPVPRPRAGVLASIALATLFITAQVAQNFLSDELGLLTGGIVAGAAVFAAYPLQKAAEHAMERRKEPAASGPAEKYRRLVETAWRDGRLGANERLMLSESIDLLGLDAQAARSIDDEVARLHVVPRRSATKSPRRASLGPDESP